MKAAADSDDKAALVAAGVVGALALPLILALAGYIVIAHSFVASCVWAWYALPLGLPAIAWKSWAGVMLLRSTLFTAMSMKNGNKDDTSGWAVAGNLLAPWFILLLAWILR